MPRSAELAFITLLAFGPLVYRSTVALVSGQARAFTNSWALGLIAFEVFVLAVVAWIARLRGWSFRMLGLRPSWRLTFAGVLLYFAGTISLNIAYALTNAAVKDIPQTPMTAGSLSFWAIVLVSVINPAFEELLVVGYVVRMTNSNGAAFAITASALLRLLYHTYQGPIAAVCILPLGLIFAVVYVRWGEIWPLVIAHAIMDLVGLSQLAFAG